MSSDDEISEEDNEPPMDEEEDVDNIPTPPIGSDRRLQMSTYNVPYQRASMYELDAYKDRGTPQPMKYTMAIHEKYCQLINRQIGKSTRSGTNKSPKVPEPRTYNGEEDAKVLEGWLIDIPSRSIILCNFQRVCSTTS